MRFVLMSVACLSLIACGGGGGGGGAPVNPDTPTNPAAPVLEKLTTSNAELFACMNEPQNKKEFIESYEVVVCTQPIATLSGLSEFFRLRQLTLTDAGTLSGIEQNDKLTNLTVSGDIGDKSLNPISGLTGLTTLDVNLTGFTSLGSLSQLTHLTSLAVKSSESDIFSAGVSTLNKVTHLWVDPATDKTAEATNFNGLENMSALTHLNVEGIPLVTELDNVPSSIEDIKINGAAINALRNMSSLTKLNHLELKSTNITDFDGVSGLPELVWLVSEGNTSLSSLNGVSSLPKLENLLVKHTSGTKITSVASLTNLPKLKRIDLDNQDVQGSLAAIANLPSMETLNLNGNGNLTCTEIQTVVAKMSVTTPVSCIP